METNGLKNSSVRKEKGNQKRPGNSRSLWSAVKEAKDMNPNNNENKSSNIEVVYIVGCRGVTQLGGLVLVL